MTTEEVIQEFISYIGDRTMTMSEVNQYFEDLGIEPNLIFGDLIKTPGIHSLNGNVWYSTEVAKLPPNQNHRLE